MDKAQQQLVEALKGSSTILVSVSNDPSVDSLSAALGLTLLLDKLDKRATAIFSGAIPPAISFLEPDKTFENTADSLRDFIIAIDKEKADHLRYKVEGDVVKIFITPYKTTLSQADLDFSQGEFNVELVVGLGVTSQDHLDKALDAHGKILHDAKVVTITAGNTPSELGGIDWHDEKTGSLSEMIVALAEQLTDGDKLIDEQIATALLTGIVSATDRFSNDHTSSHAMTVAAQLMAAGANQQLIAAKLEEGHEIAPEPTPATQPVENSTAEVQPSAEPAKQQDPSEISIPRNDSTVAQDTPVLSSTEGVAPAVDTAPLETEAVSQPEADAEPKVEQKSTVQLSVNPLSNEDNDQLELERELAGVTKPNPNITLAEIENELKQSGPESQEVNSGSTPESLVASQDASMPGFEPTGTGQPDAIVSTVAAADSQPAVVSEPVVQSVLPPAEVQSVLPPAEVQSVPSISDVSMSPEITTDHATGGPVSDPTPPLNGIEAEMVAEGEVVNPLDTAQPTYVGKNVAPIETGLSAGTPEVAQALATPVVPSADAAGQASAVPQMTLPPMDLSPQEPSVVSPVAPAVQPDATQAPVLPTLPPLPPMPANGSALPLPPPPPVPAAFGPAAGVAQSGAVSGDVFGDMNSAPAPASVAPSGPGVFKIPGQS
ncbi:hypothetical protein KC953_03020 [Candidatus Saccharibacteria bacterium]|nr:hypothetical protein [Candidatus Saccharibacteria bacterium]